MEDSAVSVRMPEMEEMECQKWRKAKHNKPNKVKKSSSYKKESNLISDLEESKRNALTDLKTKHE
ncbi:hypothetical protein RJ641_017644 [Dillenia turbinata]|uniref:Uncharacterized protein n=1 Tax=Dillenia turbinata TaxID=194707 RepID=A0AAN8Z138_9MAGN